jgi:CRP-like cAMP-binding protein
MFIRITIIIIIIIIKISIIITIISDGMVNMNTLCSFLLHLFQLESSNPSGKPVLSLQEKPSGTTIQIKTYVLDFMTSGNIIGEMGLLTHKHRSATVICETSVQVGTLCCF